MLLKSSGQLGGLPRRFELTAHTRWRNQWRSQLIGAGHLDTTWSRIRMVGRQRAAPGKCIGSNSLSRAERDAGRGLSTPIVHRITELDGPTKAIGPDVEESRIGHGQVRTAGEARNRSRCDRYADRSNLQWHTSS